MSKMRFSKQNAFFVFVFSMLETEKQKKKRKRPQNHIKIVFFNGCHPKMTKMIFLLQKLPDTICVRKGEKSAFSCTLSVLAKKLFWSKTVKARKTIKIVVSAEIVQNLKWHLFKGVFWHVWNWVLLTVLLKAVFLWKHYFIVFSAKHSSCNRKLHVKKQKIFEK